MSAEEDFPYLEPPKSSDAYDEHALDSDDDDKSDGGYDILREDDIIGQEEGTVGYDGKTQFTPFNMKEEMEEGHFDKDGTYHWNKQKEIKDNWLDNIDWVKIKTTPDNKPLTIDPNYSDDSSSDSAFDRIEVYKKIVEFMKPGETIGKSLRRLGGNKKLSTLQKWKMKKMGVADSDAVESKNKQDLVDLTELANDMMFKTGNMDIYEESYEYISDLVSKKDKGKMAKPKDSDTFLDMYADDFDEKEKARMATKRSISESNDIPSKVPKIDIFARGYESKSEFGESSHANGHSSTSSDLKYSGDPASEAINTEHFTSVNDNANEQSKSVTSNSEQPQSVTNNPEQPMNVVDNVDKQTTIVDNVDKQTTNVVENVE